MSDAANDSKAEELKKELFALQAQSKKIDDEIVMHRVVLENNKVGMKEPLVDKDDFPRSDIDVYAVRHARANINRLENDGREVFNKMQTKLEELHSLSRPKNSS